MNTHNKTSPANPVRSAKSKVAKLKSVDIQKLGVIGLGIMGSAMAGNLIKAGFEVYGFDPDPKALKRFKHAGGVPCNSTKRVAAQVQVMITSLPNAHALMATALDMETSEHKGLIVIETSTLDNQDKFAARDCMKERGVTLLDCPLSGTGAQALKKDLTVYASGPEAAVKQLSSVFEGFSKAHFYLGEFGNGMNMKLMANLLVAVHNISTAEALLLGERFGIPVETSVKVLSDGAGGSRMLQVRGPLMQDQGWSKEVTMKVAVWQKDMKLINEALSRERVAAPLFNSTIAVYNAAMGMGHEMSDTAVVYEVLRNMSSPLKAHKGENKNNKKKKSK